MNKSVWDLIIPLIIGMVFGLIFGMSIGALAEHAYYISHFCVPFVGYFVCQ